MGITDVLALLGGLALFLYGMQMMSTGLEAAAGNRMKSILEKTDIEPCKRCAFRSSHHSGHSVVFCNDGHGSRVCKFRIDDIKTGGMGDHGSQYRNDDYRSAHCS